MVDELPTSSAEAVARAYARGLLPARAASSLFWWLAPRAGASLQGRSVVTKVKFQDAALRLRLPFDRRQNWTTIFGGFVRSNDAAMLAEFSERSRAARGIIDVGANAGLYTYHAAALASPGASIIAVEAIAELADLINANLVLNHRAGARAINVAASDTEGQVTFFLAASDQISSLEHAHMAAYGAATWTPRTVQAKTVDRIVDEAGLAHVDLIKIDVEGHELNVLAGAKQTLRKHRPVLFLEAKRETTESARQMLCELGYKMRRFDPTGCAECGPDAPSGAAVADFLCEPHDA